MRGLLFSLSLLELSAWTLILSGLLSDGVVGLDRLLTLMTYIGYTRCRLFFYIYKLKTV